MALGVPPPLGHDRNKFRCGTGTSARCVPQTPGHASGPRAKIVITPSSRVVARGGKVTLKATSSPLIQKYEWTFAPSGDWQNTTDYSERQSIPDVPRSAIEGHSLTFAALQPLNVTLTVTDQHSRSAQDHVNIKIRPRPWETKFKSEKRERPFRAPFGGGVHLAGREVCAVGSCPENQKSERVHFLHRDFHESDEDRPGFDWAEKMEGDPLGYTIQTIDDDGPFDGYCYVANYGFVIERTVLINDMLLKGGVVRELNEHSKHKADFEMFMKSLIMHEHIHSDLVGEQLKRSDPAKTVESLVWTSHDELKEMVVLALRLAETDFSDATAGHAELKVHERLRAKGIKGSGVILDADNQELPIPSFADFGEDPWADPSK